MHAPPPPSSPGQRDSAVTRKPNIDLRAEQRVRGYRLLSRVEVTGRGEEWLVDGGSRGRLLLRRLEGDDLRDLRRVQRFNEAAGLGARLNNPMVLRLEDAFELDGRLAVVVEMPPGRIASKVLDALRARGQQLSAEAAATLVLKVSEALDFGHQTGPLEVLHEGLTPASVYLCANGQVRLVDGGFVALERASGTPVAPGEPVHFLPPERVRGDGRLDLRSDVYGCGALLYALLTGMPPFAPMSDEDTIAALGANGSPPLLETLRADVPQSLAAIVRRAMSPNPDERYPNPGALNGALAGWLDDAGGSMRSSQLAALVNGLFPGGETRSKPSITPPRAYRIRDLQRWSKDSPGSGAA